MQTKSQPNTMNRPTPSTLLSLLRRPLLAVMLFVCASAAQAHSEATGIGGFAAGLLHPVGGLDHLLAMVAVGIWGAMLGRPLLWVLPVVFPLVMVVGGVLGIAGVALPMVETGIAGSVVVLGIVIALAWRAPVVVAMLLVGIFGIFHGHAHGTELPASASPAAYAAGFVMATGLLHLAGIAMGLLTRLRLGTAILRGCGVGMALVGTWVLMGTLGAA